MRPDSEIKRDVEAELRWDPDVDATDIGVAVKNGVLTLVIPKTADFQSNEKHIPVQAG